jgi:DNA-binding response OmpR family regulator
VRVLRDPGSDWLAGFAADRRWRLLSKVLLLTSTRESAAEILPSLSLLDHTVRLAAASADALHAPVPGRTAAGPAAADPGLPDAVLIDARRDLVRVRDLLRQLSGAGTPLLAVISEGAWAAIAPEWGIDDVILHTAGPGEVEARLRLAIGRAVAQSQAQPAAPAEEVRSGELVIDEATYSARIRGVALDLTFKEFELLKFLAQHPRRVFTRSQLLQEVWGYDYFGGTRTVDVHVRRLRAKLGTENEALIGTVRNVGYKFVPAKHESRRAESAAVTAAAGGRGKSARSGQVSAAAGTGR